MYGNFAFTSFGNSGGKGLVIHDSGDTYYGFPSKSLFSEYWGTSHASPARTGTLSTCTRSIWRSTRPAVP